MSLLLKDIEELRKLDAETYELDPTKKYLVIIEKSIPPYQMEALRCLTESAGLKVMFVSGIHTGKLKMFELEHQL